ncbi:UDP-N-acetylmuramoyl-tripeptide--D-alanyl-D-alanine ligase [Aurantibacter sp.]|uniref:UDP-N-acetylmuramoyl-tripeptide--D-alanyl-D- alanine ligase n=1 Tax=Aurantibacter sp. TaxID=2807103 RepID=UPI0035C7EC6F
MTIDELHKHYQECNNVSTDTRKVKTNDIYFALKGENFNGNSFANQALKQGAKYVVIDDEGIEKDFDKHRYLHVENSLTALQKLAKFHRQFLNIPIIGLTGSNGKTTTKELINAVLSQKFNTIATVGNLNNHIGVPLTLLSMNSSTEIGIVEMGANHKKEIEFLCEIAQPDFGYITNFGKAHLEGFGGIEGVIKGKSELYHYLKNNNKIAFVNLNDEKQIELTKKFNIYTFGTSSASTSDTKINLIDNNQELLSISYQDEFIQTHLTGQYNFYNISAAICIGNYFKVNTKDIKNGLENYIPTNNRSQIINNGSTKIILDAYNANPSSMQVALENLNNLSGDSKIVFLGDMFELGLEAENEHQNIAEQALNLNIKKIYLIGANFNKIKLNSNKIVLYKSFEDLKIDFKNINIENSTILIKGSRGMALERILTLID